MEEIPTTEIIKTGPDTGIARCPEARGGWCDCIIPVRFTWSSLGLAGDFLGIEDAAAVEGDCPDCGPVSEDVVVIFV
jgi:hypothetical protein